MPKGCKRRQRCQGSRKAAPQLEIRTEGSRPDPNVGSAAKTPAGSLGASGRGAGPGTQSAVIPARPGQFPGSRGVLALLPPSRCLGLVERAQRGSERPGVKCQSRPCPRTWTHITHHVECPSKTPACLPPPGHWPHQPLLIPHPSSLSDDPEARLWLTVPTDESASS